MNLPTVAVMLLVTESCGYLTQNAAQAERDQATQRREERKEGSLGALRSSVAQIRLGGRGSRIIRAYGSIPGHRVWERA